MLGQPIVLMAGEHRTACSAVFTVLFSWHNWTEASRRSVPLNLYNCLKQELPAGLRDSAFASVGRAFLPRRGVSTNERMMRNLSLTLGEWANSGAKAVSAQWRSLNSSAKVVSGNHEPAITYLLSKEVSAVANPSCCKWLNASGEVETQWHKTKERAHWLEQYHWTTRCLFGVFSWIPAGLAPGLEPSCKLAIPRSPQGALELGGSQPFPAGRVPSPPLPLIKNLIFFFYEFVCLFLKYNWPTTGCEILVHNTVIWYFHTLQNDLYCMISSPWNLLPFVLWPRI